MKRFISVFSTILIFGSALSAHAQKLTPHTTYYNRILNKVEKSYTTLPDGTMHGTCRIYHQSTGKIGLTSNWDKGILTHLIIHYEDGSPSVKNVLKQKNSYDRRYFVSVDYTSYDIYGKVDKRYTMRPVADSEMAIQDFREYKTNYFEGYILDSYSDNDVNYRLSADNKTAEIKYTNGNHYVYDFDKEILTIKSAEFSYYWRDIKFTYKNNIATIDGKDKYNFLQIGQSVYDISKGLSVKIPILTMPLTKKDFFDSILYYAGDWYSMNNQFFYWFGMRDFAATDIIVSSDFTKHLDAYFCGVSIKFEGKDISARLTKGDKQNGSWEYTSEDGNVLASLTSENGVFTHISYRDKNYRVNNLNNNYTGSIMAESKESTSKYGFYSRASDIRGTTFMPHGDGQHQSDCEGLKIGKFDNGKFVSGTVEITDDNYYKAKSIRYTIVDQKIDPNSIHIIRENGEQFVGCIYIPYAYNTNYISGTYTSANGNKYTGNFNSGNGSRDDYYYTKGTPFYNRETGKFSPKGMAEGKADITTDLGKYVGDYKNGNAEGMGRFTDKNGNEFEGKFQKNILGKLEKITTHYKFISGEVYVGEISNGKFNGKGKLTMPNGDFYEGTFAENKFMGNGNVRVTTNKGVYEGLVADFKSPDKSTKIKAPKIPKFKLEDIQVGVTADE